MKTPDDDIQLLTNQLKEWSAQIATLATMQQEAITNAAAFAQQISVLSTKHLAATKQIRDLKSSRPVLDIWENIGCGG
jgi:septal ring factor EnvC (AmiA/AmiB activator)